MDPKDKKWAVPWQAVLKSVENYSLRAHRRGSDVLIRETHIRA